MANPILQTLFPDTPRKLPGHRAFKISFRAAHVLCAGVLVGAFLFTTDPALRGPWIDAALVTGVLILALDLYESGVFLLQVRGIVVVLKLVLLALLPHLGRPAWVLGGIVVASVIFSHAPSKVRYFLPFGGDRFHGAETKG